MLGTGQVGSPSVAEIREVGKGSFLGDLKSVSREEECSGESGAVFSQALGLAYYYHILWCLGIICPDCPWAGTPG